MPDATRLVKAFVFSPTVHGSELGDELSSLLKPARRTIPSSGPAGSGTRSSAFSCRPGTSRSTSTAAPSTSASTTWPHPPVADAEVTLTAEATSESSGNTSLKVLGIGGGTTVKVSVVESFERSVGTPEVFVVTMPAVFDEIDVRLGPSKGTRYLRLADFVREAMGFAARPLTLPRSSRCHGGGWWKRSGGWPGGWLV